MKEIRTSEKLWKQCKELAANKNRFQKFMIWVFAIVAATAKHFSKWCDEVFDASVDFLNYFNRWGGNYELNSVIICVAIPIIIYLMLSLMFIL